MHPGNEDQFNTTWRSLLQRPSARSWLCDPTPISLDQAVLLSQEPPATVTARELCSSSQSKHTLYVLGHDGPFALGTLTEEGDVLHDSYALHGTAARSAIVRLPEDAIQLCAAFYWLSSGILFVRVGVIGDTASNGRTPAKTCTWTLSRTFEPQAARGISQMALSSRQDGLLHNHRNDYAPVNLFAVRPSIDRRFDQGSSRQNCASFLSVAEREKANQSAQPALFQPSPYEEFFGGDARNIPSASGSGEKVDSVESLKSAEGELWNSENQELPSFCSAIDLALHVPPVGQKIAFESRAPQQFGAHGKLPISKLTDPRSNFPDVCTKAEEPPAATSDARSRTAKSMAGAGSSQTSAAKQRLGPPISKKTRPGDNHGMSDMRSGNPR